VPPDALTLTSPPARDARRTPVAPDDVRPAAHVTLHLLEQQGVVFDATRQAAYALNQSGTYIWCCLESGMASSEIAAQLERTFGITRACAVDYLDTALRHWRELGLIVDPGRDVRSTAVTEPPKHVGVVAPGDADGAQRADGRGRPYLLLDTNFQIRVSAPRLQPEIELLLAPLAGPGRAANAVHLELREHANGFSILREGRLYASCGELDQAVPLVKTCLIEVALNRSGDFGALHAAALCRDGRCVLLAGPSGAGKSTLTAALVAAGFELMADDTTVLARETLEARPVPFAICLKRGAWELLKSRFPAIDGRPIHHRLDGKKVRYLVGTAGQAWAKPTSRRPVHSLVFLNRVPEAKSSLERISRAEALSRFSREFCPLGDGLTAAKMDQLVTWIRGVDCFELRYSPLDDGVEQLVKLCR
jgi:Coenzyme PQQ synthesis protein D (PqqD)